MPNPKKPRTPCLVCGREPEDWTYKYCSNACQHEYQYQTYIQRWFAGEINGLNRMGLVTGPIKKYLRIKYENKCCLCGWAVVNPYTGIIPLVADHVDGDWRNNKEENLRLVCPNCDSLMPTYAGANKGKGRPNRPISKRVIEAREIVSQRKS